nr:Mce protein [Mycolicibacter senuensis]
MSDREDMDAAADAETAVELPDEPETKTDEPEAPDDEDPDDEDLDDEDLDDEDLDDEDLDDEDLDDEAADEAPEDSPDEAGGQTVAASRRSRLRWIAAAVLALGLIVAGYEGWLLFTHHQRAVAAAQALETAEKYALVLTGVDPAAIDKNFVDVLDGATGEFKDMYAASSEQLRQLLIENKAAAHGTVIDAAVKSATKHKVEVMLFIDQSVSNKAAPQPKIDRSRIVMTMEKVNGRWLAAKVDMP